nr:MAG TPA: hypothetical protein [Caudoviricetes sp.]
MPIFPNTPAKSTVGKAVLNRYFIKIGVFSR